MNINRKTTLAQIRDTIQHKLARGASELAPAVSPGGEAETVLSSHDIAALHSDGKIVSDALTANDPFRVPEEEVVRLAREYTIVHAVKISDLDSQVRGEGEVADRDGLAPLAEQVLGSLSGGWKATAANGEQLVATTGTQKA
ncbi:hypothetical protein [Rhodococcus sp. JVH1]|uniref:hypothetical protein n=1 Tax=Rhodococcus sp. JVH1 TaxID=745408 RepID=UPI0002720D2C|nr:hypothetical protein [Rhodococcus sp. JVH1]EJJ01063.1 hypothetical protein JVH1_1689 [Rhodococcus sp. JVH1]